MVDLCARGICGPRPVEFGPGHEMPRGRIVSSVNSCVDEVNLVFKPPIGEVE